MFLAVVAMVQLISDQKNSDSINVLKCPGQDIEPHIALNGYSLMSVFGRGSTTISV